MKQWRIAVVILIVSIVVIAVLRNVAATGSSMGENAVSQKKLTNDDRALTWANKMGLEQPTVQCYKQFGIVCSYCSVSGVLHERGIIASLSCCPHDDEQGGSNSCFLTCNVQ